MSLDYASKFAVRSQPLPLEDVLRSALGGGSCSSLDAVVPKLVEGHLEQGGGVEPLVGRRRLFKRETTIQGEVFPVGEQHIAGTIGVATLLAHQALIFASAHFVGGVCQMARDVEGVEDDSDLGDVAGNGVTKWLSCIHHGELDAGGLVRPQVGEKAIQAGFITALSADPYGVVPLEIADDDRVVVILADGDFIDASGEQGELAGPLHLLLHIEIFEILRHSMAQALHFGGRLVRHAAAHLARMRHKALGVARVLDHPVEMFYIHVTPPRTVDVPALKLQVNVPVNHREIAYRLSSLGVTAAATMAAAGTECCLFAPFKRDGLCVAIAKNAKGRRGSKKSRHRKQLTHLAGVFVWRNPERGMQEAVKQTAA